MPSKPYMPFWVGDYLSATGNLSQGQHGAYVLLILHYWKTGPLPSDFQQLFNIARARTRTEKENVRQIVSQYFTLTDKVFRNTRLDKELLKFTEIQQKRSDAGLKGSSARWKRDGKHKDLSLAKPCQPEPEPKPEESPSASQQEVIPNSRSASKGETERKIPVEKLVKETIQQMGRDPNQVKDFESAIFRNEAFKAFDDARESGEKGLRTGVKWLANTAITSLFQNRGFKELAGVDQVQVFKKVMDQVEDDGSYKVWLTLKDHQTRKHQVGGRIFKLIAQTAAEMAKDRAMKLSQAKIGA